jgi:hypothetical protein
MRGSKEQQTIGVHKQIRASPLVFTSQLSGPSCNGAAFFIATRWGQGRNMLAPSTKGPYVRYRADILLLIRIKRTMATVLYC